MIQLSAIKPLFGVCSCKVSKFSAKIQFQFGRMHLVILFTSVFVIVASYSKSMHQSLQYFCGAPDESKATLTSCYMSQLDTHFAELYQIFSDCTANKMWELQKLLHCGIAEEYRKYVMRLLDVCLEMAPELKEVPKFDTEILEYCITTGHW